MKLVIDRKTWIRGDRECHSYLLRPSDKHRCCLGFLAKECGIPDHATMGKSSFGAMNFCRQDYAKLLPDFLLDIRGNNTPMAHKLMQAQDANIEDTLLSFHSEAERENWLKAEFAIHGIEVEFIN